MDKTYIAGVPCLQFQSKARPKGTVLLYHGWGSTMESYAFFASLLTDWGYHVIVPELPHHGERGTLDYSDAEVLQVYFWDVVRQGSREASEIAAAVTSSDGFVAMVGHSAGGFISAGAFAHDPRVNTAVVINGSCAWVKFEELYRERYGAPAMDASRKAELEAWDPLAHLSGLEGKSLLLLHGTDDQTVPIDSQQYFMNEMAQRHTRETKLKLIEYPRVNHYITIGMLQAVKEWLEEHF